MFIDGEGLYTGLQAMGTWTVAGGTGFTPIRISAGGPYTDSLGQYWAADYGYLQGSPFSTTAAISGTPDQRLYQTERWNQPVLTYQFIVPNGNYTVTLKFAEIYDTAPGQRYMNATLNSTTVFTYLDVWTSAGGPNRAYDLSYPVSVTNGQLTITLNCASPNNSAEVNAIQIVAGTTQQYYLTTAVSPSGAGTVSPGSGWYNSGSYVTITASPASGYHFTGFTGSVNSGSNPLAVAMNSSLTETANFAPNTTYYTLTTPVSPSGGGTVSPSCPGGCSYASGSQVTITATPASGYQFNGFTGSVNSGSNSVTVTMNSAMTETANFTTIATQYQLTTNVGPAGTGTISPATGLYNAGAMTITATPNSGYAFSNFSGTYSGTTNPLSINLSGTGTITANFVPGYTISGQVTLSGNGSGVSGVSISASGSQSGSTITDANGMYLLPGLAAGGSYTVTASKSGYGLSAAQSFTNLASNQTASFTATPSLSINGGSNSAEVAPSTNVSMAFNLYDQGGANDIGWAQFYLADSSGNAYCYGDWGRPNGLDLYDGNTGVTYGFGINQSDSFCTVSLTSITNSPSDPTEVTVVLSFNFNPGTGGTYTVLTQINYGSGYAGPWQALGTVTVDPAFAPVTSSPVYQPPPDVEPVPTPPAPVSASISNCADISNTWTIPGTIVSMALTQAGSNVTGTGLGNSTYYQCDQYGNCIQTGSCPAGVNYSISGSSTTPGSFSLNVKSSATDNCGVTGKVDQEALSATITSCSPTGGMTLGTTGGGTTVPTSSLARLQLAQPTTSWTGTSNPPSVTLTLDLMAGKINTQLAGQKTADLTVNLNNTQGQQMLSPPLTHSSAQDGNSFSDRFRTSIQPGQQYGSVVATWDTTSVTVPVSFFTIGYTHFTQYNTPYQNDPSCSSTLQAAYIIYKMDSQLCYYQQAMLPSTFIAAAGPGRNGTGVTATNTVLKAYAAGAAKVCPPWDTLHPALTFFSVDSGGNPIQTITGAHSKVLSDATNGGSSLNKYNPLPGSLATDPCATNAGDPRNCTTIASPPVYVWSDAVLLFDQSDSNDSRGLRSVQDLCDACKYQATQSANTYAHMDMYNGQNQSCNANAVGDYGYYYAIRLR